MEQEKTLPIKDKLKISEKRISDNDDEYLKILEKSGLAKLADGRIVKKVWHISATADFCHTFFIGIFWKNNFISNQLKHC